VIRLPFDSSLRSSLRDRVPIRAS